MLCLLLVLVTGVQSKVAPVWRLPPGMSGNWSGSVTFSPSGPRSAAVLPDGGVNFTEISMPDAHGNVYILHRGFDQLLHLQPDAQVQYCTLGAEATFEVVPNKTTDTVLTICWRGPRLPSHASGCMGCDCAEWTITVNGTVLTSSFQMSPPAIHVHYELTRSGDALSPNVLKHHGTAPDGGRSSACVINNSTDTSRSWQPHIEAAAPATPLNSKNMNCPFNLLRKSAGIEPMPALGKSVTTCTLLNTDLDVRLAYTVPELPCMPCAVNFTFSMRVKDGDYAAIGFKELNEAYRSDTDVHVPKDLPNYWGMATAVNDTSPLGGRILATTGSCLRHLTAQSAYVGVVEDVKDDGFFSDLRVEKRNGRLSISFATPPLPFGKTKYDVYSAYGGGIGGQRVMWATGSLWAPDNCTGANSFSYHNNQRAVMAVAFPLMSMPCPSE